MMKTTGTVFPLTRMLFFSLFCGMFIQPVSVAQDTAASRKAVNLPRGELANLPFSDAVLAGNTLYISGQGGFYPETRKLPADAGEEAKLLMEQFKKILGAAGMTMDNLVSVTVYSPDLSLYATFNEVYRSYFSRDFPSRAFVGSGPLLFGMRFEMQGIAVR